MPCSSLNINVLLAASLPDTKWSYLNINDLTRPCLLQGKTLQYFNWVFTVQQTIFENTNCDDTITIKTPFSNPYLTPFLLNRTTKTRLLDKCNMLVSTVKLSSSSPQIPTLPWHRFRNGHPSYMKAFGSEMVFLCWNTAFHVVCRLLRLKFACPHTKHNVAFQEYRWRHKPKHIFCSLLHKEWPSLRSPQYGDSPLHFYTLIHRLQLVNKMRGRWR